MPKEKKKFSKSVNIEDHKEINNREDNHQFKQTDKNSKKESTLENNEDNNKSDKQGYFVLDLALTPDDDIPEVMEMKNYPKFFLTVQWHPEFLSTDDDVKMLRAFCHAVAVNK